MALINRYGPRRSLIWALANNISLYPLAVVVILVGLFGNLTGQTPYECPYDVQVHLPSTFLECLVTSIQVSHQSQ